MNKKIYAALESFEREDGSLSNYNDDGLSIYEVIDNAFIEANFNNSFYSIKANDVFSSPALDCGYVSVAWFENGCLYHGVYEYESR